MVLGSITISREWIFAVASIMTTLSSGGLVLGFGPVYTALVEEKQWHELCPSNSTDVCPQQEVQLQNVYTTGFLCVILGQAAFGACLDIIGPRYTTLVASLFSITGNIFMSLGSTKNDTAGLIVAGYALIAFGGMGFLFASLQLAELFTTPPIFCGILVAAYYTSGYIYVLLEIPIARSTFYQCYALIVLACAIICYVVFPVHHVSVSSELKTIKTPGIKWIQPEINLSRFKGLWKGVKVQLRRRDFWVVVCMGSYLTLISIFVGGAIPNIVKRLEPNDVSLQKLYTNYLFPLISNSSFLFAPLAGYIIENYGFRVSATITVIEFSLLCGAIMLPWIQAQILSYVLISMGVGSLTSIQYAYVMECFPSKLYGLLSATITLLAFIICLLSYALTPLAQNVFHGNNNYVMLILLGPALCAFYIVKFFREPSELDEKDLFHTHDAHIDQEIGHTSVYFIVNEPTTTIATSV
ncbi:hypothetical protein THRCLA_04389 [Thraustotheca clavata]|uniref:Major Facilitator Superfamily (MFS) n=1 Tax=Thraustotheca clavata TaxID=74557 RepID=A0A1V9ZZ76_9STRA|nr:hypothetical protein THRCLA_04389 [Thraustotheca clavata]